MRVKYIKSPDVEDDVVDVPLENINIGPGKSFNNNAALAGGDMSEAAVFHPYIEFDTDPELPKSSANVASTPGSAEGLSLVNPSVHVQRRRAIPFEKMLNFVVSAFVILIVLSTMLFLSVAPIVNKYISPINTTTSFEVENIAVNLTYVF